MVLCIRNSTYHLSSTSKVCKIRILRKEIKNRNCTHDIDTEKNRLLDAKLRRFVLMIFFLQDWFDRSSENNYRNTTQCLVQQYNKYFQRPLRIDSRSIMIEVSKYKYNRQSRLHSTICMYMNENCFV